MGLLPVAALWGGRCVHRGQQVIACCGIIRCGAVAVWADIAGVQ